MARGVRHPIFTFLEHGIPVAVCTDNTTVSDTDQIRENRLLLQELTVKEIEAIHREAANHSFIRRAPLLVERGRSGAQRSEQSVEMDWRAATADDVYRDRSEFPGKDGGMHTRKLELLRPDEILEELRRCPVVFLPLAPLEWHGPHLPYGVDPLIATELALRLAERLGGIVHPCLFLGTERERDPETLRRLGFSGTEWVVGMDFPANSLPSLYLPEEVLAIVVRHQIYLLQKLGFRHVVLVNGHGGRNHVAALKRLCGEISAEGRCQVHYAFTFPEGAGTWSRRHHASTDETAVMRHLFPDTVNTAALPPAGQPIRARDFGVVDEDAFEGRNLPEGTITEDPRVATAALGERHLAAATEAVVAELCEKLTSRSE